MKPFPSFLWLCWSLVPRLARWLATASLVAGLTGCHAETAQIESAAKPLQPYSLSPPAGTVIGDLGGVPVSIPREYVRLVEYEGDPHWLEKRKGPLPQRTYESKLTSFAVLIHFPTMKPLTRENRSAYENKRFWDMEWITTGVSAGTSLQLSDQKLARPYEWYVPGREFVQHYDYERLPDVHGLKAWRATRVLRTGVILDDKNRKHSMSNHHLYLAYEGDRITAHINCGGGLTSAPGGRNTCSHSFMLWPEMRAEIDVVYGVEMLEHWRTYQQKMRELMLSFRVNPIPSASQQSATPASGTTAKP